MNDHVILKITTELKTGRKITMRSLTTILFFVIVGCSTNNKTDKQLETLQIDSIHEEGNDLIEACIFKRTQKQEDTYPFDESNKIEIVSYDTRRDGRIDLIDNGKFIIDNIQQRIMLGKNQRDSLFSILFNLKSSTIEPVPSADCYNPRHSIVFYKNTKAIAFFEICFECGKTQQSSGVYFGQMCPEKWCILQNFFKSTGTNFGIIEELCE